MLSLKYVALRLETTMALAYQLAIIHFNKIIFLGNSKILSTLRVLPVEFQPNIFIIIFNKHSRLEKLLEKF